VKGRRYPRLVSTDLHATVAGRLSRLEQRYTTNRRDVVVTLLAAGGPRTIPELQGAGAGRAQSSLYRNLSVLEEAGVVHRVPTVDGVARYELSEDLTDHHHHLVCRQCGTVEDFAAPAAVERAVDRAMQEAAASGFSVESHRLDLVGLCARCR
jgi:Fe2+ or Zn2+ uptake regulation protein